MTPGLNTAKVTKVKEPKLHKRYVKVTVKETSQEIIKPHRTRSATLRHTNAKCDVSTSLG